MISNSVFGFNQFSNHIVILHSNNVLKVFYN